LYSHLFSMEKAYNDVVHQLDNSGIYYLRYTGLHPRTYIVKYPGGTSYWSQWRKHVTDYWDSKEDGWDADKLAMNPHICFDSIME